MSRFSKQNIGAKVGQHADFAQQGDAKINAKNAIIVTAKNVKKLTAKLPFHAASILASLTKLKMGSLVLHLPNGNLYKITSGVSGPNADVTLHNWNPARRVILGGTVGAAESYIDREWDSSDVTKFLGLLSLNYELGNKLVTPIWFSNSIYKIRHWLNSNSKTGSKRNIAAHYDLGNDFYQLWLDDSMTYSSALFSKGTNSLEAAQSAKYKSLVKRMNIGVNDHVLEIGCGWGGFAEYTAKNTGAHITGLTISQEQLVFAQERIFKAGLNEKVHLKFQDYRDEKGVYDKIASIEMFEAVGEKYWDNYFSTLNKCLKTGGKAGLQIITIANKSFENYRMRPDFIQRYIFPGGMLASPKILSQLAADHNLAEEKPLIFAHDYARTLAIWRETFLSKWDQVAALGFDDRFKRMWEFYMYYCEAGFKTQNTDVRQVFYIKE